MLAVIAWRPIVTQGVDEAETPPTARIRLTTPLRRHPYAEAIGQFSHQMADTVGEARAAVMRGVTKIMLREVWRAAHPSRYRRYVESPREPMEPERRLPELDRWEGLWVAVKDGEVVAAAPTSRELVPALHKLGDRGRGAVAQFVPKPTDKIIIGVG